MAGGVLVPWPEVGPEPLVWEHRVQNSRLSENSWPQWVMITENAHEGLHPNLRPSTTHLPAVPGTGCLTQQRRQQHKPNHQQADILSRYPKTQHVTGLCPSDRKISLSPTRMQKKVPLNMNLHKSLKHTHPLGQRPETRTTTLQPGKKIPHT